MNLPLPPGVKPPLISFGARRQGRFALFRSASVRFALGYAVVFGLSTFVLAFSLWYATVGLLQRQVESAIRNDIAALSEHGQIGGVGSVASAIQERLGSGADADAIYLLLDPEGNRVVGNLDQWPAGLSVMDSWYELPVSRAGQNSTALLRAETLDSGGRLLVGRDSRAREELRMVLRNGLLSVAGLMLLLGVVGAVLIRSLFRRMLRDISVTTRAIARGDLSRRVPVTGSGDEFDEMAATINDMLERISRLMDGVRQVSNAIAHDLRTPVARARARLEDAALHAEGEEAMQMAIERATQDLDGIVGLFEALLRIAEIEAGSRRAAFASIDLAPVLRDMDELYRPLAEERNIGLQTAVATPLMVMGDRELVQQAVANLLDNALKFAPPGTIVSFTARAEDEVVEIVIADRGPGIAPTDIKRATERFFRAEAARSTSGSGLGLALVAAVTQLHNGTLHLGDNVPGLRAVLSIPAMRTPAK